MIETAHSSSSFDDILLLLNGNRLTGSIAAQSLSENVSFADTPRVFHCLCTSYCMSASLDTQHNACTALNMLSKNFSVFLAPLISQSMSDGELLTLQSLDLEGIMEDDVWNTFMGDRSIMLTKSKKSRKSNSDALEGHTVIDLSREIYQKDWIKKQRKAIMKYLKKDTRSESLSFALSQCNNTKGAILSALESECRVLSMNSSFVSDIPSNVLSETNSGLTDETWLARLLRYLVSCLLSPRWESRHGSALALTAVLSAVLPTASRFHLAPFASSSQQSTGKDTLAAATDEDDLSYLSPLHYREELSTQNRKENEELSNQFLPLFLIEDIICAGFCVLVLDRFIDLESVTKSPVKDAVARLMACAAVNLPSSFASRAAQMMSSRASGQRIPLFRDTVFEKATQILDLGEKDWSVRVGGLVLMKYLIPVHLIEERGTINTIRFTESILSRYVVDSSDDVCTAAVALVSSLCLASRQYLRRHQEGCLHYDDAGAKASYISSSPLTGARAVLACVRDTVTSLERCAQRLGTFSLGVFNLCVGVDECSSVLDDAVVALLSYMSCPRTSESNSMQSSDVDLVLTSASLVMRTMSVLLEKMCMYSSAVRVRCFHMIISCAHRLRRCIHRLCEQRLHEVLVGESAMHRNLDAMLVSTAQVFACSIKILIADSNTGIGDFYLVDKERHESRRLIGGAIREDFIAPSQQSPKLHISQYASFGDSIAGLVLVTMQVRSSLHFSSGQLLGPIVLAEMIALVALSPMKELVSTEDVGTASDRSFMINEVSKRIVAEDFETRHMDASNAKSILTRAPSEGRLRLLHFFVGALSCSENYAGENETGREAFSFLTKIVAARVKVALSALSSDEVGKREATKRIRADEVDKGSLAATAKKAKTSFKFSIVSDVEPAAHTSTKAISQGKSERIADKDMILLDDVADMRPQPCSDSGNEVAVYLDFMRHILCCSSSPSQPADEVIRCFSSDIAPKITDSRSRALYDVLNVYCGHNLHHLVANVEALCKVEAEYCSYQETHLRVKSHGALLARWILRKERKLELSRGIEAAFYGILDVAKASVSIIADQLRIKFYTENDQRIDPDLGAFLHRPLSAVAPPSSSLCSIPLATRTLDVLLASVPFAGFEALRYIISKCSVGTRLVRLIALDDPAVQDAVIDRAKDIIKAVVGSVKARSASPPEQSRCLISLLCGQVITVIVAVLTSVHEERNRSTASSTAADAPRRVSVARLLEACVATLPEDVLVDTLLHSDGASVFAVLTEKEDDSVPAVSTSSLGWLAAALAGLGSPYRSVRALCTKAFRRLVPLVPLARAKNKINSTASAGVAMTTSSALLEDILSRNSVPSLRDSIKSLDVSIMAHFATLFDMTEASSSANKSTTRRCLRDYQWEGVSWLTHLRRCGLAGVLADEMGLGKTLMALSALAVLRIEEALTTGLIKSTTSDTGREEEGDEERGNGPATTSSSSSSKLPQLLYSCNAPMLVICPASVVPHWQQEIKDFFPSALLQGQRFDSATISEWARSNQKMKKPDINEYLSAMDSSSVMITSFEFFRQHSDEICYRDSDGSRRVRPWNAVVIDEAHIIKNPSSIIAQCVFKLHTRFRVALTGTPIQNQVEELWSLMNFLIPDFLGDRDQFRNDVVNPIKRSFKEHQKLLDSITHDTGAIGTVMMPHDDAAPMKWQSVAIDLTAAGMDILRRLQKQVLPFVLRRTKATVAKELPPKTIIDIMCPLTDTQRRLYSSFQKTQHFSDDELAAELADKAAMSSVGVRTIASGRGVNSQVVVDSKRRKVNGIHPFQALSYLQLLTIHPALVISKSHPSYRRRLLEDSSSSGKIIGLLHVLVDSEVVTRSECLEHKRDELEAILNASHDTGGKFCSEAEESQSSEDEDDEGDEGEEERGGEGIGINEDDIMRGDSDDEIVPSASIQKGVEKMISESEDIISDRNQERNAAVVPKSSAIAVHATTGAHRCLIFSRHKAVLDIVEECVLSRYFPTVAYERLDGDVSATKRGEVARAFNSQCTLQSTKEQSDQVAAAAVVGVSDALLRKIQGDTDSYLASSALSGNAQGSKDAEEIEGKKRLPSNNQTQGDIHRHVDIRILLLTSRSCGLGLNLTAADTVIFIEHDWNPIVDLQAMDRAHRLGQTKPVHVYRLLAQNSIEERIVSVQNLKTLVASEVIKARNLDCADGNSLGSLGQDIWKSVSLSFPPDAAPNATYDVGDESVEENLDLESFLQSLGIEFS